jgi:hypothetical protein
MTKGRAFAFCGVDPLGRERYVSNFNPSRAAKFIGHVLESEGCVAPSGRTSTSFVSFKVATSTLRTLEHKGGFDSYILKQDDSKLSKRALTVKNKIKSKLSRPPKAKTAKK